jgi:hypothetical protein
VQIRLLPYSDGMSCCRGFEALVAAGLVVPDTESTEETIKPRPGKVEVTDAAPSLSASQAEVSGRLQE